MLLLKWGLPASGQTVKTGKEMLNSFPGADTSKTIKELQYLADKKCVSGYIIFFGPGFYQATTISLSGAPDHIFLNYFKKFFKGTKIAFEKYFYLNERGEKRFISKIFLLP